MILSKPKDCIVPIKKDNKVGGTNVSKSLVKKVVTNTSLEKLQSNSSIANKKAIEFKRGINEAVNSCKKKIEPERKNEIIPLFKDLSDKDFCRYRAEIYAINKYLAKIEVGNFENLRKRYLFSPFIPEDLSICSDDSTILPNQIKLVNKQIKSNEMSKSLDSALKGKFPKIINNKSKGKPKRLNVNSASNKKNKSQKKNIGSFGGV